MTHTEHTTHKLPSYMNKYLSSKYVSNTSSPCSVMPSWHLGKLKQDVQLSQRDRAAGCVIVFAKSRTLELGDNILRTV